MHSDDAFKAYGQVNAANQKAAYNGNLTTSTSEPATEAEYTLDRLRMIRSKLAEVAGMSKVANEKIIGPAPTPLPNESGIKGAPIAQGFMAQVSQLLSEIDSTSSEIAEQLSRLHRSF